MFKELLIPDWRKLIVYLIFVIIFMAETLLIRSVYEQDYMILFLSNIYNYFFRGLQDYVNFFTVAFFYYIIVLTMLYFLSCVIILIVEKIEK